MFDEHCDCEHCSYFRSYLLSVTVDLNSFEKVSREHVDWYPVWRLCISFHVASGVKGTCAVCNAPLRWPWIPSRHCLWLKILTTHSHLSMLPSDLKQVRWTEARVKFTKPILRMPCEQWHALKNKQNFAKFTKINKLVFRAYTMSNKLAIYREHSLPCVCVCTRSCPGAHRSTSFNIINMVHAGTMNEAIVRAFSEFFTSESWVEGSLVEDSLTALPKA